MYYEVIGTDCCLVSHERMRIGADGSVGIGGENNIIERYPFLTAGIAAICADIFNRDIDRQQPLGVATWWVGQQDGVGICSQTAFAQAINLNGREVFRCNAGYVEKLDVPHLVWCWLRTTGLVRGAKALWKGWA